MIENHMAVPNVLAARYASTRLRQLWSPTGRVVAERQLWVTVLENQARLGVPVPRGVVDAYRAQIEQVDLGSIRVREQKTRHDLAARIEEFSHLAGHQHIHKGLTSRDVTENVEQMLIRQSLQITRDKTVALLARLGTRATEYQNTLLAGRTHNVAAQPTTLGKRFANAAQETLLAFAKLESLLANFPLRGLKGAVGTQQDLLDLFDGDAEKVSQLEKAVAQALGFTRTLPAVGQIYPRSMDLEVISVLNQLVAGPASLATTLRLMAGHGLVGEGLQEDQVGSSAMPHKVNMRTSERINGLAVVLSGYLVMATGVSGQQWNEGDVSDSVVRRVAIPDAFFACDGLLESALAVLGQMEVFPGALQEELETELPFLTTTRVLMAAVREGMGRESAHRMIREHVRQAIAARRAGQHFDWWQSLGKNSDFPLGVDQIRQVADVVGTPGLADQQVQEVVARIGEITATWPQEAAYQPEPIL